MSKSAKLVDEALDELAATFGEDATRDAVIAVGEENAKWMREALGEEGLSAEQWKLVQCLIYGLLQGGTEPGVVFGVIMASLHRYTELSEMPTATKTHIDEAIAEQGYLKVVMSMVNTIYLETKTEEVMAFLSSLGVPHGVSPVAPHPFED